MAEDPRIKKIHQQIRNFLQSDFTSQNTVQKNGDEIDAILSSLNKLGKQLRKKILDNKEDGDRIQKIMDLLLKYTIFDFSEMAPISDKNDEIDAIAAGLNALGEEIDYSLEMKKEYENKLKKRAAQLETINKEMEAFTYTVSHDLRSPLRAIHGYSQVLMEDYCEKLDSEGIRILDAVMVNAHKMGNLIDDLLDFSRLGRKEINRIVIDTNRMVIEICEELKFHYADADIKIYSMPEMNADYSLITQVFQNLISNALKFTSKEEKPVIEIGATNTENGIAYYVKDNGIGFDMVYHDKIFGVFQRLHRETEFEGTGVGLAIVKRIISRHNGNIWAESTLNNGSVFYFSIGDNNNKHPE